MANKRYFLKGVGFIDLNVDRYSLVDVNFTLKGKIPRKWRKKAMFKNNVSIDFLDIDGMEFCSDSGRFVNTNCFECHFSWNEFLWRHVDYSEGRIALRIGDELNLIIPIIISGFDEPSKLTIEKHIKIENHYKRITKRFKDFDEAYCNVFKDFDPEVIWEPPANARLIQDVDFISGLAKAINTPSIEKLNEVYEEYKDVMHLNGGPRCKGLIGINSGMRVWVYTNDHDEHFHVRHTQKEIEARFDFPELELRDYVTNGKRFTSKELKNLKKYLERHEVFKKLKNEIERR